MLVLSRRDVEALLEPELCLEAVERAMVSLHRGKATQPERTVVPLEREASALFMPGLLDESPVLGAKPMLGTKVVTIYPANHELGIASHHGGLLVFEAEAGRPTALIEGSAVTAIRTAAVSALATRLLARPESRVLALLGTGVQARSHLVALLAVHPFESVRVWSPRVASREAFLEELRPAAGVVELTAAESAEQAVRAADVLTTHTSARPPIAEASGHAAGCHTTPVGESKASTREIDTATVVGSALFVDYRPAAEAEAGELMLPVAEGAITTDHVRGDLGALAAGAVAGRTGPDEITLFKSVGLAVQDLAAAAVLVEAATERGMGQVVDWT